MPTTPQQSISKKEVIPKKTLNTTENKELKIKICERKRLYLNPREPMLQERKPPNKPNTTVVNETESQLQTKENKIENNNDHN